jgi:hypothetical protein
MLRARPRLGLATLCVVSFAACGHGSSGYLAPSSPQATVTAFLDAVQANNLDRMSELWGSSGGPARNHMDHTTLEQRLTVIKIYLRHDRFTVLESNAQTLSTSPDRRVVRVRLSRDGCTPVVPFTTERYGKGWLVSDIDLTAAGNPAVPCAAADSSGATR